MILLVLLQPLKIYGMLSIILTMFIGIGLGFLLKKVKFLAHTGKAISLTIYAMLFVLGAKIGTDEEIIKNLSGIGLQALVLAMAGILGSAIFALLVYKFFFKDKQV